MTNYNDGKWHGWNGGECPVHPQTFVEVQHKIRSTGFAVSYRWGIDVDVHDGPSAIIAFRVIKEHREPREFWIAWPLAGAHAGPHVLIGKPSAGLTGYRDPIHVREVLE